jgi:hypothetical protein
VEQSWQFAGAGTLRAPWKKRRLCGRTGEAVLWSARRLNPMLGASGTLILLIWLLKGL